MTKQIIRPLLLCLLASTLLLAACRATPVYNVRDAAIPPASSGPLTMGEIQAAIIQAGTGLGWQMIPKTPGHIIATHNLRTHQAVVDITYDRQDYSINYKSSMNLKYDGTNIHNQYNAWITYLTQAIDAEIASAQYK